VGTVGAALLHWKQLRAGLLNAGLAGQAVKAGQLIATSMRPRSRRVRTAEAALGQAQRGGNASPRFMIGRLPPAQITTPPTCGSDRESCGVRGSGDDELRRDPGAVRRRGDENGEWETWPLLASR
jgi:hypothetical protein